MNIEKFRHKKPRQGSMNLEVVALNFKNFRTGYLKHFKKTKMFKKKFIQDHIL